MVKRILDTPKYMGGDGYPKLVSESEFNQVHAIKTAKYTRQDIPSSPLMLIGYVGGTGGKDAKKVFWLSATFSAGMAFTFTALGTAASLLGKLFQGTGSWWYILLGVLMSIEGCSGTIA